MAVPAMTLSSVCLFLVFHEETLPDCDRVNEALSSVCPAAFLSQSSGSATLFGVRDDPDTIDFLVRSAQAILSSVDSDGDGEISFAEFRRLWGRGKNSRLQFRQFRLHFGKRSVEICGSLDRVG